jgi:hypothetical protein
VAGHLAGTVVAEVRLLGAATRVGIGQPQRRALSFTDFLAAIVANENGLTSQLKASFCALITAEVSGIPPVILRRCARPANPRGTKQRKERAFLGVELDIAGADDA